MAAERRTLSFGITGEFITQIAREWLYVEGMEQEKTMELLKDSMKGTDTPEATIRRYAEDILLGRAALVGSTSDGSYHLELYDPGEEPGIQWNIFEMLSKAIREKKRIQKQLEELQGKYAVAREYIPSYMEDSFLEEIGEPRQKDTMLESFIKRMTDEEEHETEDYGWLEPDGTFHGVEWARHQEFAEKYIRENMTEEEWQEAGVHMPGQIKTSTFNTFGDYLVSRGWVLLHNPQQGIARPTKDPAKRYTKKQRDFLYAYYIDRGCRTEADEVMEE